jgi:hypothetical protein
MISPKQMQNLTKIVEQAIKPMATQNKQQGALLDSVAKSIMQNKSGDAGMGKIMKELSATLTKTTKLITMQTQLLDGVKVDDLKDSGSDDGAEKAKELEDAVKQITDENKKQAAELEKLMSEIEKAGKDGGDKDAAKKIKVATQALEKAAKLIDEQSKLLDEARKALSG